MLFLSGLLGMMALGSVLIVGAGTFEEESVADDVPGDAPGGPYPVEEGDRPAQDAPLAVGAEWPLPDDGAYDQSRSLFARMGLINLPFQGTGIEGKNDPALVADVLQLEAFEVSVPPAEPPGASASDVLNFDAENEQLLIVYDDSAGSLDPVLELRASPDDPEMMEIVVDGSSLGRLHADEAPPLSSIIMVGESTAAALSLG